MHASLSGHAEVVRILLAAGADHAPKGHVDGNTALMLASDNGHALVVRDLLVAGAAYYLLLTT